MAKLGNLFRRRDVAPFILNLDERSHAATSVPALLAAGLIAGLFGGLFGAGTTVFLIPALVTLFGFSQHRAQGTGVAVVLATALVAVVTYARHGHVAWEIAMPATVGSVLFAFLGASLVPRVSAVHLQILFFLLILVAAIRLFLA